MGVFVTAALVVVVALTMGQGEAKPKDALALIFGIVAAYLVLLFFLQSRDLSAAEAAAAREVRPDPGALENPATLDEPALWSAMAVHPIDADAVRARRETWSPARTSIRTGMLVCALIFLTVPPIYLLDTFVPLFVGVPLIAGVALWRSVRLLAGGGELDQAYERTGRAMAPLGLAVAERPEVSIEPKGAAPLRMGTTLRGALVLRGERHGRAVEVRMPAEGIRSTSEVRVAAPAPPFALRSRDGRVRTGDDAPAAVRDALGAVRASTRWKGVRGGGGDGTILVERKGAAGADWLLDLWLAERLADAVETGVHGKSSNEVGPSE